MDRMVIFFTVVSLLAGCQGSTVPMDPFAAYGPTRIPPPATGSARQGDPYYRGTTSATTSSLPGLSSTAQALPPTVRFTSNDAQPGAPQLADSRSAAAPSAVGVPPTAGGIPPTYASVPPSGSEVPANSGRRLDWRSPVTGATGYPPSATGYPPPPSAAPQAPPPAFPTGPSPAAQGRY